MSQYSRNIWLKGLLSHLSHWKCYFEGWWQVGLGYQPQSVSDHLEGFQSSTEHYSRVWRQSKETSQPREGTYDDGCR